jgi:hypothetical protein
MKQIISAAIVLFFSASLFGQDVASGVSKRGTTAAPFLSIGQGARAAAMGSAYVAVSDDPSSMFWNPAGITKLRTPLVVDHTEWFADINYNFMALVYNGGHLV